MRLLTLVFIVFTASLFAAEQDSLKVFISADMEGVGGVSTWEKQSSSSGMDYEQFRRLMTLEVNAAIEGAFDAGATEVLVSDSHGDGQNIDVELLDRRANLLSAWPRPMGMMAGIDESYDAVVFIGYHGAEGQAEAILSHTEDELKFADVKLNGVSVSESGIGAAIAGHFGVPVVFISGDQTVSREARDLLGDIETAIVKTAHGFYAGTMMHPEKSRALIYEGVKRGVERRGRLKPYKLSKQVKLQITFKNIVEAEVASYLRGVKRPKGNVIVYTADNALDAASFLYAVYYLKVD